MNKISFYKFFMVHYDYLIKRYLCSMAFSAFTRYHLQFCSSSSSNIASGTKSRPGNMPKECGCAYRSLELLFGMQTFNFNCFFDDFNCVFTQIRYYLGCCNLVF